MEKTKREIKEGDTLVCLWNRLGENRLTVGKRYISLCDQMMEYVEVTDDLGEVTDFHVNRFEVRNRKDVIANLLKDL